jgi:membrane fusion protein, multidrug efflux system
MAFDTPNNGFFARYRWWIVGASALVIAALMWQRATRPTPVGVVEVTAGPAERVLAITGRTRPQVTVNIVPKQGGQILRLTKEEGQTVQAGDVLVQLDAEAPRAAVDEVDSKIAAQTRALAEARRNFERIDQLKNRGLATVKEFDTARFDLDQAQAELVRLNATRREVGARLRDNTITAPVAGVVLSRPVDPGQVVTTSTVIYEIAPLADVEVEADVDEQFLAEVREGLKADILVAGRPAPFAATLTYVSPKVDPRTGGAKVRLRFDAPVANLRSGLTADINLIVEKRPQAITVARSAILGRDTSARVLVVDGARVIERPVSFIEWPSEKVIVTAGLEPGQQLLAQPRPDLIGEHVAPTTNLASVPAGERPRGSEARRAL